MAKVNANVELSNSFVVGGISVAAAGLCWVHFSNDGEVLPALKKQFSAWGNFIFSGGDKSLKTPATESKSDDDDNSFPETSSGNKKRVFGWQNIVNHSYMNSLLQCMFHTEELVNVIVTNPSRYIYPIN